MRIAFDHEIFTNQRFGGISRYYVNLAAELQRNGQSPRIFAGFHINEYLRTLDRSILSGAFLPIPTKKGQRLRYRINRNLNRLQIPAWRPDLIHGTFFNQSQFPRRIPRVVTVYDMIDELYLFDGNLDNPSTQAKKTAVDSADHVICISENTRNDLIRLFRTDPEKLSVIYLGIDKVGDGEESPTGPAKPYLLYVGHRPGYKNFERFLEAYAASKLIPEFDIVAFGGGPLQKSEVDRMTALGIPARSISHISGDDLLLAKLYRCAAALFYPSLYEGFGLPPLEAMAHGCPVASSNASSLPEVVGNAAICFDPNDTEEMAVALTRITLDESLRKTLIAAGHERVKQFSWVKTAEETAEVYHRVLNSR